MRHASRTDDCQAEIVKALRSAGIAVYYLKLPVDLLCWHRGRYVLLECKDDDGRISKVQAEFLASWPGELYIVRSPMEALRAVIGTEAMA